MKYSAYWWVLFCFTGMMVSSCGGDSGSANPGAPPPAQVNVFKVEPGAALYYDLYPGTVTAINQVDVRPQVSGYINGIYFTEGQFVQKGQKLYSIDPQQYQGVYGQAEANLHVAEANLAKAQQDADRYQELAKQDAIAKQTVDHAMADLESAKRQVDAAKANMSATGTNLRYTTINAPFSGTIGISQVKIGTSVSPGQTILNTISSDDPIAVDFAPDEKQIPRIINLQERSQSDMRDSVFTISLADLSIYPFPGHIYVIDRAVDPMTGTIKVRLEFPNAKRMLRSGMSCNVRIKNDAGNKSILIPYKAVVEQMAEYFVFVINGNKVKQVKVTLGARIGDKVLVRNGLEPNQVIVTDGIQKIRDGSTVQVGPSSGSPGQHDSSRTK
jgi:membrane fusion protein (multidrug efflux system)